MADGLPEHRPRLADYDHKQYGLPFVAALVVAGVFLWEPVVVWAGGGRAGLNALDMAAGAACLLFASATAYLRVRDRGDHLSVRFGPLPVAGFSILYDEIESAEACEVRTGCLRILGPWHGLRGDFQGHWSSCSIAGNRFVKIRLRRSEWGPGRDVYVGTNEPDRLAEFLRSNVASR